jgi:flagellar biosynthetic protein FlhB
MAQEAEDRTEAATPRRIARARAEGQVPLSREAAPLAGLAAGALLLALAAPATAQAVQARLAVLLGGLDTLAPGAALRLAGETVLRGVLPFALAAAAASAAAVLAQTGLLVRPAALRPDFARLDPRRGIGRLLSAAALLEAAKALARLAAAGAAAWIALGAALPALPAALGWPPALLLGRTAREVLRVLLALVAVQAVVAGLDILRTRRAHARGLRMTRQELREEQKETEGNPQVRARIRRLRLQRARRRMLAAVPKAAVVVTNPTHYAVALAYRRGAAAAPRVVAKGIDEVAARIRALAQDSGVPLVANPPLARALHQVELDAEIPRELYQAVAELIAYVWRLRPRVL